MKHSKFLDKLSFAKRLSEFEGTNKEAADKFGRLPMVVATYRRYYERHKSDPQCPWLPDVRHELLMESKSFIKFDTEQSIRASMIKLFRAVPGANSRRWTVGISKLKAKRLMKASGLRWFELDGTPYIHWNEKETTSVQV